MRQPIRVLSEDVSNKIAAGEVIERPASVVKELVENAIDAGARRIYVDVKGAGKELIRVVDDGSGIPADQAPLAFQRHATSKIQKASDLAAISTLGFRGEALPSIASVSRVELVTRTHDAADGVRLEVAGGNVRASVCGAPPGTQVSVYDLFYNTPARFKFLKSDTAERRYIAELLSAMALAHPAIAFRLSLEGRPVLSTSGSGNLKEAVGAVYGRRVLDDLVAVEWEAPWGAVSGYVGKPALAKGNRSAETIFVNGRWVQSRTLYAAVEKGFESLLAHRRFPLAVLHVTIDPALVDVNVHPAKTEVRFRDEGDLFRTVMRAVRAALVQADLVAHIGPARPGSAGVLPGPGSAQGGAQRGAGPEGWNQARLAWGDWTVRKRPEAPPAAPEWTGEARQEYGPLETAHEGAGRAAFGGARGDGAPREAGDEAGTHAGLPLAGAAGATSPLAEEAARLGLDPRELLATAPVLGQAVGTYLVVAVPMGLWLIDQHVAHERILYEEVLRGGESGEVVSQELLVPLAVTLSPTLSSGLDEVRGELEALGFVVERFGGNDVLIRAVPAAVGPQPGPVLLRILEELAAAAMDGGPSLREQAAASIACRAAVKAGQRLQPEAMERLVRSLAAVENPFACPHGRPIIVQLGIEEIERRFGRR